MFGSAEQPVTVRQLWPGSAELFLFLHSQMLPSLILSEHLSNCGSFCETSVQEETKGSRDAVEMKALLYISNALTDFPFLSFFLGFLIKAFKRPFFFFYGDCLPKDMSAGMRGSCHTQRLHKSLPQLGLVFQAGACLFQWSGCSSSMGAGWMDCLENPGMCCQHLPNRHLRNVSWELSLPLEQLLFLSSKYVKPSTFPSAGGFCWGPEAACCHCGWETSGGTPELHDRSSIR